MLQFVKFTEHNEWEGETWNFWLQVNGNETALAKLADALRVGVADSEPEYELASIGSAVAESTVDDLIEHADDEGYMCAHNKVTGVLTVPDDLGDYLDKLYKGQITNLFSASTEERA